MKLTESITYLELKFVIPQVPSRVVWTGSGNRDQKDRSLHIAYTLRLPDCANMSVHCQFGTELISTCVIAFTCHCSCLLSHEYRLSHFQISEIAYIQLLVTTFLHLHLQHRQHASHEEETSNNRRKTKSLHCPQLYHHDADGLAGQKTWRTTQTTVRRYKCAIRESVHSSWYFNIWYMGPLLYTTSNVEFCWFYNFYFYI
jgi:hypothetical protein